MRLQMETKDFDHRRWICLLGAMLIVSTDAWKQLWSITFNPLINNYGIGINFLNSTYSIYALLATFLMLIAGKMVERFGASIMIFVAGISYFIGMALPGVSTSPYAFAAGYILFLSWSDNVVYIGAFDHLAKAFPDRRGLTMSIAAVGISCGEIILPPLCQRLITNVGLNLQFIIIGIILLAACLFGLYLCPTVPKGYVPSVTNPSNNYKGKEVAGRENHSEQRKDHVETQKDWRKMLLDPGFYLYFTLVVIAAITGITLMSQGSLMAQDIIGVTPAEGAWMLSSLAIVTLAGRIFWGWLGDKTGRLNILICMFGVMTIVMMGIALSGEGKAIQFIGCMLLGGFTAGGLSSSTPAIVTDLFGTKNFALNFAIIMCALPIGQAIIPWIAKIAVNGSYFTAFTIEAFVAGAGVLIAIILKSIKKRKLK